jgi:hypothetical protein
MIIPTSITLLWWLIRVWHSEYRWLPAGDTYNSTLYMISFVLIAIPIHSTLYTWFRHRGSTLSFEVGALLWWMILMLVTSVYLPGGSYLFTWPLLFSMMGLVIVFARKGPQPHTVQHFAILSLSAMPGILLFTPIIYLMFISLTLRLSGAVMVMIVLLMGLLMPLFDIMTTPAKWRLSGMLTLGSLGCLVAAGFTAGFDNNHPKPNSIFYGVTPDTQQAVWASTNEEPDEWTAQFFPAGTRKVALPDYFPFLSTKFLSHQAHVAPIAAPHVELLADHTSEDVRTLHVRITSLRQAPVISIYVDSPLEVLEAMVNGKHINNDANPPRTTSRNRWGLRFWAPPEKGIELTMTIRSFQPLQIRVVDQSYGLPEIPGMPLTLRPAYMMPTPFGFGLSDVTLVSKSYTFGRL